MEETQAVDARNGQVRPPSSGPYLIGCAVAAGWIALGTIHRDQHSDSLLNVLISLQRWTLFVWEQDRFGMAIPLLAIPIKNPLLNMIFQAFLSSFAGLATFFLLARLAFRDARYPSIGAIGAASFLVLTPPYYRFEYLVDTSYGTSLALALWALILVEPDPKRREWVAWSVAILLMGIAHWINSVTAFFLGPFLFLQGIGPIPIRQGRAILTRWIARNEACRGLIALAVGYAIGQFLIGLSPDQPTNFSGLDWTEWPESWRQMILKNLEALDPPAWPLVVMIEVVIGLVLLRSRGHDRPGLVIRPALSLIFTAVGLWLLLGTRMWVKINAHAFRYLFPSALLGQTAAGGLLVAGLRGEVRVDPRSRAKSALVVALVLLGASTWSYGLPSLAGVRRDIDRRCGTWTADLLAARCTLVAGDYWNVWVAVFHANLVLYERGDARSVHGLTFRASPTYEAWRNDPVEQVIVAVPANDGLGETYIKAYPRLKFERIEVRPTIQVYRAIPKRGR